MADIFISYSSKDKEIADTLCAQLEKNGYSCWIASRDIIPGEEWARSINTAITASKVFLVIYSHNSCESTQVPKEIGIAGARDLAIIPYKIDNTPLTGDFEYYLLGSHWVSADPFKGDYKIAELVNAVECAIARREGREPSPVVINNNYAGDNNSVINVDQKIILGKAFKIAMAAAVVLLLAASVIIIVLLMGKQNADNNSSQFSEPDSIVTEEVSEDTSYAPLTFFEAEAIYEEMVNKLIRTSAENSYSEFAECFDDTYTSAEIAEMYSIIGYAQQLARFHITMYEFTDDAIFGMYCFYENSFDGMPMYYHTDFVDNVNVLVRCGDKWLFSRLPEDHPINHIMQQMLYAYGPDSDNSHTVLTYQTVTANVLCDHTMAEVENVTKNEDGSVTVRYQIINGDHGYPTEMSLSLSVYDYNSNLLLYVDEMPMSTDISECEIQLHEITTEPLEYIDDVDLTSIFYDAYVHTSYG